MGLLDYQKTIGDFRARTAASPWVHLDRATVADRLIEIIECPDLVQQGPIGLCGPASFLRVWLERAPNAVAEHAVRMYEDGVGAIGALRVTPCAALLAADYAALGTVYGSGFPGAAEWMIMGALRDSENFWMRFTGEPSRSWPEELRWLEQAIREGSLQDEVASWLRAAGVYGSVSDATSKIAVDVNVGGALQIGTLDLAHALAHPPTPSTDVIWMINSNLISPGSGNSAIANHFVTLLRPVVRLPGDRVGITLFSWGRAYHLERDRAVFERNYYGAITATSTQPRVILPVPPKRPFAATVEEVAGPALRLSWQCSSPNDVLYDVERIREVDPAFARVGSARAFDPPTVGTSFDDAAAAAQPCSLRYRVTATSPYGTTAPSDEAWFDAALRFRLAAWFAAESVALARLGGYAESVRNLVDPAPHLAWALTQTSSAMVDDLMEKFRIQLSRQLGVSPSAAATFYADTVLRYLSTGLTFDESTSNEGATNSLAHADHWGYAHSMLTPLSAGRLDQLHAELRRRVHDAAKHVGEGRRHLLAGLYTSEMTRLTPASAPATHRAWADGHSPEDLRDALVARYDTELDALHALVNGAPYVAKFYAEAALAWNAFGVDQGSATAASVARDVHTAWAERAPYAEVREALERRVRCVAEALSVPETFARRLALHALSPTGAPQALAKPFELRLGAVDVGGELVGRLRFSNVGGGTYFVGDPVLGGAFSAANTTVTVPHAPVDARRTVEVLIAFRGGAPGQVKGTLTLTTSAPGDPKVVVGLEATVSGVALVAAPSALDLGLVKVGQRATATFAVTNAGTMPAQLMDAQTQPWPGPFDCTGALPWLPTGLAPGGSYTATVDFAPAAAGAVSGAQIIRSRFRMSDPIAELVVTLQGRGATPRVELPATLEWPLIAAGGTAKRALLITNGGEVPLVLSRLTLDEAARAEGFRLLDGGVERVEIPEPYFGPPASAPPTPTMVVPPHQALVFELVAAARPGGGVWSGGLVIESDDPARPHASVTLRSTTAGPPRIAVSTERIDFGTLTTRARPMRAVAVRNGGAEVLEVSRIWLDQDPRTAAFQVDPSGPLSVAPGGEAAVRVRFVGQKLGSYEATLWIESNDPKRPRVSVRIVGTRGLARVVPPPL